MPPRVKWEPLLHFGRAGDEPAKLLRDLRRPGARTSCGGRPGARRDADWGKTHSVFDRYNVLSDRGLIGAASKLDRHLSDVESGGDEATFERCQ